MTTLTVSIVNHNSTEPLRKCLASLLADIQRIPSEVYVVDNLCQDWAAEILARDFPSVKVLQNSEVLGFSANHNQVLRRAQGRYVLVLNPDTLLPPGAVEQMVAFMEDHPSAAACGPRLVDPEGDRWSQPRRAVDLVRDMVLCSLYISNARLDFVRRLRSARGRIAGLFQRQKGRAGLVDSASDTGKRLEPQACTYIRGSCMLLRASAVQDVGVLDERFFLYEEDRDWCLRATERGWDVFFLPEISVLHIGGYSTDPQYLRYLSVSIQSCLAFYEKHRGKMVRDLLRVAFSLVAMLNLLRWSVVCALKPARRKELDPWKRFMVTLLGQIWRGNGHSAG